MVRAPASHAAAQRLGAAERAAAAYIAAFGNTLWASPPASAQCSASTPCRCSVMTPCTLTGSLAAFGKCESTHMVKRCARAALATSVARAHVGPRPFSPSPRCVERCSEFCRRWHKRGPTGADRARVPCVRSCLSPALARRGRSGLSESRRSQSFTRTMMRF